MISTGNTKRVLGERDFMSRGSTKSVLEERDFIITGSTKRVLEELDFIVDLRDQNRLWNFGVTVRGVHPYHGCHPRTGEPSKANRASIFSRPLQPFSPVRTET